MGTTAYLDFNATAPVRPAAAEAMAAAIGISGNASSVHAAGREARRLIEEARRAVAALVGADPANVVFTSGGTEAAALALAPRAPGDRLLVSAVEHPCVLAGGRFAPGHVETIPVDSDGVVDLGWLERRLETAPVPAMVSVMAANNETGVLQPVAEVARLARAAGALAHCDAVQAAGRTGTDLESLGVDLLSLSAHKLGGPQGVGALIRRSRSVPIVPLWGGGGQERSLRTGTEAVPAIAGFGAAARLAAAEASDEAKIGDLRDWFERSLRTISPSAVIFASGRARLANTSCFAVPGVAAESAMIALDLEGVCVSSGSACSSGKVGRSHVLAAMGVTPDLSSGAIRMSLGWSSTRGDVERLLEAWRRLEERFAGRRRVSVVAA